jgi:hypothetical protein
MKSSLPLLAHQFVRGLRDEVRLATASTLTTLIEKPDSTIDDLARELKSLALFLPEDVVGATRPPKVNTTNGRRGPKRNNDSPQRKETRTRHYCGKVGHLASECCKKTRDATKHQGEPGTIMSVSVSTINQLSGRTDSIWLDSGATHHVVHDKRMLQSIRTPTVSSALLGGGEEHTVHCEGDLLLTGGPRGSVLLTSVLHVPTLGINLMSTPQITSKKGSCWEGEHAAHVYDRNGKVVLNGHKVDGMYRIDCKLPAVSGASVNVSTSADMWHRRFGHIGYGSLRKMSRNKSVRALGVLSVPDKPQICDVCDKAKLKRVHFAPSSDRAKHPLELVHSDTMGPMPERGLEDELYVVTALDDFSGYAEAISVRSKDEAAPALVNLLVKWQRLTGAKVKGQGSAYW